MLNQIASGVATAGVRTSRSTSILVTLRAASMRTTSAPLPIATQMSPSTTDGSIGAPHGESVLATSIVSMTLFVRGSIRSTTLDAVLTGPDAVLVRREPLRLRDPDRGDLLQRRRVDPDEARGDAYPKAVERVDDIPSGGKVGVPRRVHRRRIHLDQALQRGHPHRAAPRRDIAEDVVAVELQEVVPHSRDGPRRPGFGGRWRRRRLALIAPGRREYPADGRGHDEGGRDGKGGRALPPRRSVAGDDAERVLDVNRGQLVADHGDPSANAVINGHGRRPPPRAASPAASSPGAGGRRQ